MKIIKTISIFFIAISTYGQNDVKYINSQENIDSGYPFSEAVVVDNVVYLSGKVGRLPSGELIKGGIEAETIQALKNIESVLDKIDLTKKDIFKCTCMLVDIKDWPKMSKAYKSFFERKNLPARSAFAGGGLALGAKVEIECLAKVK
ncbi:MAG: RidA family protein [Bacteroidota bacterium]|nr:RidA family protein [Bacteroidota bacterium]